jgi:hypothetical protein
MLDYPHMLLWQQLLETPERIQKLLQFLEETGACNKLRASCQWEPTEMHRVFLSVAESPLPHNIYMTTTQHNVFATHG